MPANDIFELSVDATYNGQQMTNVMHFQQVGADGTGDARSGVAGMWASVFQVAQAACQITAVQHVLNRVRRVLPTQTQTSIFLDGTAGAFVGNGLPNNQCAILRLYGAISGRKGIGHQKMYGVGTSLQLAGRLSTGWRDLCDTYGVLFASDQTDVMSGYVFRAGILGNDGIIRQVQGHDALPRVKQVHSRTAGVGD